MFKKVVITLLAIPCIYGCSRTSPPPTEQIRPVKLYKTESLGEINRDFAGMSVATNMAELAFRVSGQLLSFNIEEGKVLKKGFLIASLDPRDFQYKVDAARSVMVSAKARFDRVGRLLKHQAISQQDYEIAKTQYDESRSAYDNADGALNDTKLYTPFSGNIEKTYVNNYQRVSAGEPVARLVSPITLKVRFTIPDIAISLLSLPDKSFHIEFDSYPNTSFSAYLHEYVETSSDATGVPVTLIIDDKRVIKGEYKVYPGMSCNINMKITNQSKEKITAVPISAIYAPASGGTMVWVYNKDGFVHSQNVEMGDLFGVDMVTITNGITPGVEVVSAGVYKLSENEQVKVLK